MRRGAGKVARQSRDAGLHAARAARPQQAQQAAHPGPQRKALAPTCAGRSRRCPSGRSWPPGTACLRPGGGRQRQAGRVDGSANQASTATQLRHRCRNQRPVFSQAPHPHPPTADPESTASPAAAPRRCTRATVPMMPTRRCAPCALLSCLRTKIMSSSSMRDLRGRVERRAWLDRQAGAWGASGMAAVQG